MDSNVVLGVLGAFAFAVVFQLLRILGTRLDRLSRLEGKVDALLQAGGVDYDPFSTVPADVRLALEQGE